MSRQSLIPASIHADIQDRSEANFVELYDAINGAINFVVFQVSVGNFRTINLTTGTKLLDTTDLGGAIQAAIDEDPTRTQNAIIQIAPNVDGTISDRTQITTNGIHLRDFTTLIVDGLKLA